MTKSRLSIGACSSVIIWIVTPILIMLLNLCSVDQLITYKIWINILYICGSLGIFFGGMYLTTIIEEKIKTKEISPFETIIAILPLILFVVFGIWSIICTANSDLLLLSIFGRIPMSDSLFTYFALFGMILSGIAIGRNKKETFIVANVFIAMSLVLAIIALLNNDLTTALCVNERTNCLAYTSVFYNSNHYAYYLAISLIVNAYLLCFVKNKYARIYYSLTFIISTITLVLNDTIGSYLAVLLTFIFAIIWSFINKEEDKKSPVIILVIFIATSIVTMIFSSNLSNSFGSMFSDIFTISSNDSTQEEIGEAGSGRILLWKAAVVFIKTEPIFGWGPQTISMSSHNMFLQIAIYFGIPGLLIYLLAIVSGVIALIKERKSLNPISRTCGFVAVAYLISGFFGVTVFYTAPYFYLILGFALSRCLGKLNK